MKGKTIIKLTNVMTGETEVREDHNMFTNALDEAINRAPYFFANTSLAILNMLGSQTKRPLTPLNESGLGGLLLFPKTIQENAETIFAPADNKPTGIASHDAYSGTDTRRGSYNENESGPLSGEVKGYKHVWDFNTSQANGPILCAALTSARGGIGYWDGDQSILQDSGTEEAGAGAGTMTMTFTNALPVGVDDGGIYVLKNSAPRKLYKYDFPRDSLSLTCKAKITKDGEVLERLIGDIDDNGTNLLTATEFWQIKNSGNASGNATLTIDKYNLKTWEKTTQTITVAAPLEASHFYKTTCIVEGFLYMIAYNGRDLYKINLQNVADVTLIENAFITTALNQKKNLTQFLDGVISTECIVEKDGTVHRISFPYYPVAQVGIWLINAGHVDTGWYNLNLSATQITPYLATINNLEGGGFFKNAQQTMKVTYIVTEE